MNSVKISIKSIRIYHQSEKNGDEIYLKYNSKKIWPEKEKFAYVGSTSLLPLNVLIQREGPTKSMAIELWEYDTIFPNTCLGIFGLNLFEAKPHETYTTDLISGKGYEYSRYSITWGLVSIKTLKEE